MVVAARLHWAAAVFAMAVGPIGSATACSALSKSSAVPTGEKRRITAQDLIGLREIGHPDSALFGLPSPLAVDPSRRSIAFVVSRADAETNAYCRSLVVLELDGRAPAKVIDSGGDIIVQNVTRAGILIASGSPLSVVPLWSPDGSTLAYLRRDQGKTQIWLADRDGQTGRQLTHSDVDVETLKWGADGRHIIYQTRATLPALRDTITREGKSGYLYDDRFVPTTSAQPQIPSSLPLKRFEVEVDSGQARAASVGPAALSDVAWRAEVTSVTPSPFGPRRIIAVAPTGDRTPCQAKDCQGRIAGAWALGSTGDIVFLRREGWANERMGLYRWRVGAIGATPLLRTATVLNGCTLARDELVCLQEAATQPRRVVGIDLRTRRLRVIYDPNPETRNWAFGTVRRLRWRNARGFDAYGDLVLPPGIKHARSLPLIIVQYRSVGFLRGGTGDEYPIHLFAQAGFAVLSIEQPNFVAATNPNLITATEINAFNLKDWAERRSLLSSLEAGIDKVLELGIADPERIGLTGLSDGATTARFALLNTSRFAAASISSCCVDPDAVLTLSGPAYAAVARQIGYPPLTAPDDNRWRRLSLDLNADRMSTPLLMQLPDDEYLLALRSIAALREHGQPSETFVFPGEHHIKVQPTHRLAIYNRNLDWFTFWLQGRENPSPQDPAQFARWRLLRTAVESRSATLSNASPAPILQRRPSEGHAGIHSPS